MVKLLTNPLLLRATLVFFVAASAFLLGVLVMRRLRRNLSAEANASPEFTPSLETLPLHTYHAVIQQLKQQKHELQVQTQAEQRRARTTENFSHAVLSNLSSGVLVFGLNGLVRQANPAAKNILGFASPAGMNAEDIFRGASVRDAGVSDGAADAPGTLADAVHSVLHGSSPLRQMEADYRSPAGEERRVAVTITPVPGAEGTLLGAACLISDLSEFDRIRRQQELHGEISAEMALELRTSLATISGYAQQLASTRDSDFARQLASDIASEAARLDRTIGGFLAEARLRAKDLAGRSLSSELRTKAASGNM